MRVDPLPSALWRGNAAPSPSPSPSPAPERGDPIPRSVPNRDAIYRAASAHGVDPSLLASFAAQESGTPGSTTNRNVAVGADGHGRGMFQIDDRYHAIARTPGVRDPVASADYAARLVREGLDAAHHAGLRGVAAIRGAANYYHAGTIGNRESPNTRWPDSTLHYDDSLVRHYEQMRAEGHR